MKKFFVKLTNKEINTLSLALLQKELRDKHNIDVIISKFLDYYIVYIHKDKKITTIYEESFIKKFSTYENALESGINKASTLIK